MADADVRGAAVRGRSIRLDDILFGADPGVSSLSDAARADTLRELIHRIFASAPEVLSAEELAAFRAAINAGESPVTHTNQRLALKDDDGSAIIPSDFAGANAVTFANGRSTATAPSTPVGVVRLLLWRAATDPEPTFFDLNNTGFNQIGALVKQTDQVTIDGVAGNVWQHERVLAFQGAMVEFR